MCTRIELRTILNELEKSYLEAYGSRLSKIILYGSYARGDYRDDSDIDVAAIVKGSRPEIQQELNKVWDKADDLELEYEVIVSPTAIPLDEYEKWKDSLPYYRNIENEGVMIHG